MAARLATSQARLDSILVWLNGALGDTLLGFPALQSLRELAPDACITAIGRPAYLELATIFGYVDAVEDVDGRLATRLFTNSGSIPRYDVAVIWSSAFEHLRQTLSAAGTNTIIAMPPRGFGKRHQSQYLASSIVSLGIGRVPHLRIDRPDSAKPYHLRGGPSVSNRFAVLHPGAGATWKQWPVEQFLTLASALRTAGLAIHWSFGPADGVVRESLLPHITPSADRVLEAPALPLLGEWLASSALVVSGDTGVAHLAALYGAPTITLFGPTDPRRWRPIGPFSIAVVAPDRCGGNYSMVRSSINSMNELSIRRCAAPRDPVCDCLANLTPASVMAHCRNALSEALNM